MFYTPNLNLYNTVLYSTVPDHLKQNKKLNFARAVITVPDLGRALRLAVAASMGLGTVNTALYSTQIWANAPADVGHESLCSALRLLPERRSFSLPPAAPTGAPRPLQQYPTGGARRATCHIGPPARSPLRRHSWVATKVTVRLPPPLEEARAASNLTQPHTFKHGCCSFVCSFLHPAAARPSNTPLGRTKKHAAQHATKQNKN